MENFQKIFILFFILSTINHAQPSKGDKKNASSDSQKRGRESKIQNDMSRKRIGKRDGSEEGSEKSGNSGNPSGRISKSSVNSSGNNGRNKTVDYAIDTARSHLKPVDLGFVVGTSAPISTNSDDNILGRKPQKSVSSGSKRNHQKSCNSSDKEKNSQKTATSGNDSARNDKKSVNLVADIGRGLQKSDDSGNDDMRNSQKSTNSGNNIGEKPQKIMNPGINTEKNTKKTLNASRITETSLTKSINSGKSCEHSRSIKSNNERSNSNETTGSNRKSEKKLSVSPGMHEPGNRSMPETTTKKSDVRKREVIVIDDESSTNTSKDNTRKKKRTYSSPVSKRSEAGTSNFVEANIQQNFQEERERKGKYIAVSSSSESSKNHQVQISSNHSYKSFEKVDNEPSIDSQLQLKLKRNSEDGQKMKNYHPNIKRAEKNSEVGPSDSLNVEKRKYILEDNMENSSKSDSSKSKKRSARSEEKRSPSSEEKRSSRSEEKRSPRSEEKRSPRSEEKIAARSEERRSERIIESPGNKENFKKGKEIIQVESSDESDHRNLHRPFVKPRIGTRSRLRRPPRPPSRPDSTLRIGLTVTLNSTDYLSNLHSNRQFTKHYDGVEVSRLSGDIGRQLGIGARNSRYPNPIIPSSSVINLESGDIQASESRKDPTRNLESRNQQPRNLESRDRSLRNLESRNQQPRNLESRDRSLRNLESRNQQPRNLESRDRSLRNLESRNQQPRNLESRDRSPRHLESRNQQPRNLESLERSPRNLESRNQQPRNLESRERSPRNLESRNRPARNLETRNYLNTNLLNANLDSDSSDSLYQPSHSDSSSYSSRDRYDNIPQPNFMSDFCPDGDNPSSNLSSRPSSSSVNPLFRNQPSQNESSLPILPSNEGSEDHPILLESPKRETVPTSDEGPSNAAIIHPSNVADDRGIVSLDFLRRKNTFKFELKRLKTRETFQMDYFPRWLLQESCEAVMRHLETPEYLMGKIRVQNRMSARSVDLGGITRNWFDDLSREMFNPAYGLFRYTDDYHIQINPFSAVVNPAHEYLFKCFGLITGMSIFHNRALDVSFSRSFYLALMGHRITLDDMKEEDPQLYVRFNDMLKPDYDIAPLDLYYSLDDYYLGQEYTYDLIENGRDIPVQEDLQSRRKYLDLLINMKYINRISVQMTAFKIGFNAIIPPNLQNLFSVDEIKGIMTGCQVINVDDWIKSTVYIKPYHKESPVIKYFWKFINESSQETRAKVLKFVTGSHRVPITGFRDLLGRDGRKQKFRIQSFPHLTQTHLPKAHTCFNALDLPPYNSYARLKRKLTQAITTAAMITET